MCMCGANCSRKKSTPCPALSPPLSAFLPVSRLPISSSSPTSTSRLSHSDFSKCDIGANFISVGSSHMLRLKRDGSSTVQVALPRNVRAPLFNVITQRRCNGVRSSAATEGPFAIRKA